MTNRSLTLLLAALAMIAPVATDTYLPAIPEVARHFHVTDDAVQLTLSIFLFAQSAMTLFYGALTDGFGRRPVIIVALGVFSLASLGAALAPAFSWLLVFRALQGLSAAAGIVVAQAVVRDRFVGAHAHRTISHIMMVFVIAPALAPVIGGYINAIFGWRLIFAMLAVLGVMLFAVCLRGLPESLLPAARTHFSAGSVLRGYAHALNDRSFVFAIVANGCLFGGFALYISSAAKFVTGILHLSETGFAWLFMPLIAGSFIGSALSARFAHRLAIRTVALGGLWVAGAGAALNIAYSGMFPASVPWALVPLFVFSFGASLAMPAMTSIAQSKTVTGVGLRAGLQNFVQLLLFALIAGVVAPMVFNSALYLALGMGAAVLLAAVFWSMSVSGRYAMALSR